MIAPGTRLGNYEIVELLASGGMGQVYLAQDTRLARRIALKVLPAELARAPERLERFEREAKAVASLNHHNIVTIHSVEVAEGPDGERLHFLTMELVEGQTLDKAIPSGGLPIDQFFAIAVPLADAVGAAHQKGITHRDLKPGNVMVTADRRIKVLDFGLAKLADPLGSPGTSDEVAATAATVAAAPITEEGKVLGTVAYMSPEQAEGKPVDNRSDIFSLGIMLYEMITGELPFKGDTKISLMSSIIKDTPRLVTDIKRELPNHLGRIVRHCLEKSPDRRFQSAQDVRNELVGLKEEIDSGETFMRRSSPDVMGAAGAVSGPATAAAAPSSASDPSVRPPAQASAASDPAAIASAGGPTTTGEAHVPPSGAGGVFQNKLVVAGIGAAVVVVLFGWWLLAGGSAARSPSPAGRSAGTGEAETVADARPSVAVLYFDNLSGDASLDWLRSGLTDLLVTDLSQSPEIRVLTTDALFDILAETDSLEARVTSAALVREVAERGGVEHVVVGSFIRAGDTFRISARLQRPASGETLAAETVEGAGEDSVFASIDDLTRRIKNRLQVPVAASPVVDRDLSDVTTASMDAYRHYTDGVNLISQNRSEEAIPVFERALQIDPEFAMAFAKMSVVYGNLRDFDQERYWSEKAIEHADRLTQRERFYIEGRYYSQRAETMPQAIEAYENALALYPDDSASRNNVGNAYMRTEQFDQAVFNYEELLRRGTTFLPAYLNTAGAYAHSGDCDKALDLLRDFARNQPEYHFAYQDLAHIAVVCDRPEEALAALDAYRESVEAGSPPDIFDGLYEAQALILLDELDRARTEAARMADSASPIARLVAYPRMVALTEQYRGRQRDAIATLSAAAQAAVGDGQPTEQFILWLSTAIAQLAGGDANGALASLDKARATAELLEQDEPVEAFAVIAQARAGRAVAARTAARQYERLAAQLPLPQTARLRLLVEAELALSQNDLAMARDKLEQAAGLLPDGKIWPPFAEQAMILFPLAEVRLRDGDPAGAAELFTRITESGSQRLYFPYEYVRSFFYLGKIAQDDGDAAAARRHYQRFLDYWGEGDLDRDRVAEARAFVGGA
jgi:serine/threonine protein kinase/TolB-like protein